MLRTFVVIGVASQMRVKCGFSFTNFLLITIPSSYQFYLQSNWLEIIVYILYGGYWGNGKLLLILLSE